MAICGAPNFFEKQAVIEGTEETMNKALYVIKTPSY
jgi:hypothetical protein